MGVVFSLGRAWPAPANVAVPGALPPLFGNVQCWHPAGLDLPTMCTMSADVCIWSEVCVHLLLLFKLVSPEDVGV